MIDLREVWIIDPIYFFTYCFATVELQLTAKSSSSSLVEHNNSTPMLSWSQTASGGDNIVSGGMEIQLPILTPNMHAWTLVLTDLANI
jgi:NADPH-dependent ferric siderophore reductase